MQLTKYENRKLYNPETRKYINLEQLFEHLHSTKDEFQVINKAKTENLTVSVLLEVLKFNKNLTAEKLLDLIRG